MSSISPPTDSTRSATQPSPPLPLLPRGHSLPISVLLPTSLQDAKVVALPATAFYIPNFVSLQEEAVILEKIATAPKPRWKHLTYRRLQTWPSDLVDNTLLEAPLPPWLVDPIVTRLLSVPVSATTQDNVFFNSPHKKPNHVLINEYAAGVGIMPHKDGPAYHPLVCTVSLGSSLCLDIYTSKEDGALVPFPAYRILQEPRSLLIMTDTLYTDHLHGIADISEDVNLNESTIANWNLLGNTALFQDGINRRDIRTSLTYRDVMKVSKLGDKLGMLMKY